MIQKIRQFNLFITSLYFFTIKKVAWQD